MQDKKTAPPDEKKMPTTSSFFSQSFAEKIVNGRPVLKRRQEVVISPRRHYVLDENLLTGQRVVRPLPFGSPQHTQNQRFARPPSPPTLNGQLWPESRPAAANVRYQREQARDRFADMTPVERRRLFQAIGTSE